jgi:hypothetical protein
MNRGPVVVVRFLTNHISARAKPRGAMSASPRAVAEFVVSVALFLVSGPSLILVNNQLLREHGFPYPIALSACGVGLSALLARLLCALGLVRFTRPDLVGNRRFLLRSALPIGALSALTLALGNSAYVYLSVATCQVLKALTPSMTLGVLYLLRVEEPSRFDTLCVLVITAGTIVAVHGEIALPPLGLALQLLANLAEASRIVLAQRLLSGLQLPLVEMQYHVAPWQLLCLLGASAVLEINTADRVDAALTSVAAHPALFGAACALGLFLQFAGLLVVRTAGSVAMKLLGVVRGAGLVAFEVVFGSADSRAEVLSPLQLAGYAVSLSAFVAYNLLRGVGGAAAGPKSGQNQKARAAKSSPPPPVTRAAGKRKAKRE